MAKSGDPKRIIHDYYDSLLRYVDIYVEQKLDEIDKKQKARIQSTTTASTTASKTIFSSFLFKSKKNNNNFVYW